jgi:hypothetical protein
MRDDMNPYTQSPGPSPAAPSGASPSTDAPSSESAAPAVEIPAAAPAVLKFKSCRWRCSPEDGEFCTHRDVLPFAGKNDFKADSWCPECAFYKLRRTPKKRDWNAERNAY